MNTTVASLRAAGARFAYLQGSRAEGAVEDPADRVAWESQTRKIYLDERPRVQRARRDFARARRDG